MDVEAVVGAVPQVLARRWAFVRQALSQPEAIAMLNNAPSQRFVEESPVGSAVSYASTSAGSSLDEAPALVRALAAELSRAMVTGSPPDVGTPEFTDVTWNWYAPTTGHIGGHRDPPSVGGVIAVFTLTGEATFTIYDETEFVVSSGDLVLIAGQDWPRPGESCIRHAAGHPLAGERSILTLRHNVRGPGADFF